ncbi:hypothetical protein ABK040_008843 [Willaertia magna]
MPTVEFGEVFRLKLGDLFNKEEYSDLCVSASDGKTFHVIKALLVPFSKVLESMLYGEFMESNQKEITLEGVSSTALEMFLRIVYLGKIEDRPLSDFIDLIVFAHEFQMEEIEEKCKLLFKELEEKKYEEDYDQLIQRIDQYNDETNWLVEVKQSLIKIVTLNFNEFVKSKDFFNMSPQNFLLLLELDIFCGSEDEIFDCACKWIDHDYDKRIEFIDDIVQRIDLVNLSKPLLTTMDKHSIFSKSTILSTLLFEAFKICINPSLEDDDNPVLFKRRSYRNFNIKFTSLGQTGHEAPKTLGTHYRGIQFMENVELINGIQYWTVPFNGKYRITACGAGGGVNTYNTQSREGYGAKVSGYFVLTKGTVLKILVGQKAENAVGYSGAGAAGGGGGTFVVMEEGNKPLIIGAGGNGQNWSSWTTDGPDGRVPQLGVEETHGASADRGAGGGGFKFDGLSGDSCTGGKSFVNGGVAGLMTSSYGSHGGFGGGGGSLHEGGGGGGYIGGRGVPQNTYSVTYPEYGAISFNSGLDQENVGGVNKDDGYVEISLN